MKGKIFKLKKEKLDTWKEWCLQLNTTLKEEALNTLKEEGLIREYGGIFVMNGESYGYILTDKQGKPSNKEKEINVTHIKTLRECMDVDNQGLITTLYSLEVEE